VTGVENEITPPVPRPVFPAPSTTPFWAWPIRISRIAFVATLVLGPAVNVAWRAPPPGAGVTLAAETVPQNGAVSVQIGVAQVGCAPRPSVQIVPAPGGGALQATFTAGPGASIATNAIREIRIGQVQNGVVDGSGKTGLGTGGVISFPAPVTSTTLTVRRVTPGQATTVPLVIVDACGEWPTFVGGGPSAFCPNSGHGG
jgi:hypothetical protein